MKADNPFDLLLPAAMAKVAEEAGVYKATKHPLKTFYLAITAGVFISIAFVFYITATTGTAAMPYGMAKLIGGICFSLGLILCVICGADLFTLHRSDRCGQSQRSYHLGATGQKTG
ncbi:formate transporter [Salmonella bongori]|nr:formate transporter [Salmonella bongori]